VQCVSERLLQSYVSNSHLTYDQINNSDFVYGMPDEEVQDSTPCVSQMVGPSSSVADFSYIELKEDV